MSVDEYVAQVQMAQTEFATTFNGLIAKGYSPEVILPALAVSLGRAIAVTAASKEDMLDGLTRGTNVVMASARERWEERTQ